MEKKKLMVIAGPTASGKSALALRVAQKAECPILSADSRQLYRGMDIGTAKPGAEEKKAIDHYMIDLLEPGVRFSAAQYEQMALRYLHAIYSKKNKAILCGGTGFYIDAVLNGLDPLPKIPEEVYKEIERELQMVGIEALFHELQLRDPDRAKNIDRQNPRRVIRALSITRYTEQTFESFLRKQPVKRPWTAIKILLLPEREKLYQKINERVDTMIAKGLESEALHLHNKGILKETDTVGYTEWVAYFSGKISREDCIELIKRNTRRYAKRQYTWFRRQTDWNVYNPENELEISEFILDKFN